MRKVGFVGAGFNANFHVTGLEGVRGVEVVGVTAKAGAEALGQRVKDMGLGPGVVYSEIRTMAEVADTIAICAPNFARLEVMEQILAAKQAGRGVTAVIVEKPLGRNVSEARQLVQMAKDGGFLTAYYENQIHMPSVARARAQLAGVEKAMGAVHLTRSAEEHGGPHEGWFWDPTQQGGGVLCDMGCHSIAVGQWMLTPVGESPMYLVPTTVSAQTLLLKWGQQAWKEKLLAERGVDYDKVPAEDYATGMVTFRNPKTGQIVAAQYTDAWMYDAPGLRLLMEAFGPGWSYTVNSLGSPAGLFISDAAAAAVADAELALEKSQASRGALILQPNEADLYGYVGEWRDALAAFERGQDALLSWDYGLEVTKLVMASYMSAERGQTINLEDPAVLAALETYVPLIQQGRGAEVFGLNKSGCCGK